MNTPIKLHAHTGREDLRIVTLQAHILGEQAEHGHAGGTFSWILSALSISAKIIADKVRRARLENVLGSIGTENVQGEVQQKLDVLANDVLLGTLGGREGVAIVASEENEEPLILRDAQHGVPRYCVLFDPLDGSSNLDICGGVGTIFSILAAHAEGTRGEAAAHVPGQPDGHDHRTSRRQDIRISRSASARYPAEGDSSAHPGDPRGDGPSRAGAGPSVAHGTAALIRGR